MKKMVQWRKLGKVLRDLSKTSKDCGKLCKIEQSLLRNNGNFVDFPKISIEFYSW